MRGSARQDTNGPRSTPEALMSPDELADYLKVPLGTVYKWRYRRTGPPAMKVGVHLRYRRSDVDAWLEGTKATS